MAGEGVWATTLAYGVNAGREIIPGDAIYLVTHALLLESSMTFRDRHTWFGRVEVVGKPAHDLHVHEYPTRVFAVGKLEAGYVRNFKTWNSIVPGIGGAVLAEHRAFRTRTALHQQGQARIRRVLHHTTGPPRDVSGFRLEPEDLFRLKAEATGSLKAEANGRSFAEPSLNA